MNPDFLYRGVSSALYRRDEGLLRPKSVGPFTYSFSWGEEGLVWGDQKCKATWDSSSENAVIRHQLNQEGFPTSGISTTPHFERAVLYVHGKDGKSGGYIFKIDRAKLAQAKVNEFVVAQFCQPSIPEDEEVILVTPNSSHIPEAVISEKVELPPLP